MNYLRLFSLIVIMTVVGCGQQKPKLSGDQARAFDSAPTEIRQIWTKALEADKANDYVNAQHLLDSLKTMQLSDQQTQALETEYDAFGLRLWQAAEKNDPAAVKAVHEINASKSNRR